MWETGVVYSRLVEQQYRIVAFAPYGETTQYDGRQWKKSFVLIEEYVILEAICALKFGAFHCR